LATAIDHPAQQLGAQVDQRRIADNAYHVPGTHASRLGEWHQKQNFVVETDHFRFHSVAVSTNNFATRTQWGHHATRLQGHADQAHQGTTALRLWCAQMGQHGIDIGGEIHHGVIN
jgi:hypothetical protein